MLATGIYGTNLVAVRGNYDDVNRLCTEISGEHDWAFVNINMRPYYARGPRRSRSRSPSSCRGRCPTGSSRRSPRARCSRRSRAVRGVDRARAAERRAADIQRRPGRRLLAGREAFARAATSASRSSRTRSPSRWRSATRPTVPTRSTWRAAPSGSIDAVTDDEIRDGIKLLAQTTGIFTETAGGVTIAVLRKLAERGDIDPAERVVAYITGEGLKTLDCARGTFEAWEIEPTGRGIRAGERAPVVRGLNDSASDGRERQDPDAAARGDRRRVGRRRSTARRSARCSTRCTSATASSERGSPRTAACAGSSTSTSAARTSASWTASTRPSRTATRSRSCRPSPAAEHAPAQAVAGGATCTCEGTPSPIGQETPVPRSAVAPRVLVPGTAGGSPRRSRTVRRGAISVVISP